MLFDTAKLLNVCLQLDDCPVHYIDHPNLVHIGGMSMYLSSNAVRDPVLVRTRSTDRAIRR